MPGIKLIVPVLLLLISLAFPLYAGPTRLVEDDFTGQHWQAVSVKEIDGEEETVRGHLLFTLDSAANGVAFRCEKGKLAALVSSEPVDFRQLLQLRFHGSEDWPVSFSLNGSELRNEDWVQLYRGRIFMVRELQTTRELFNLAYQQGNVEFTRKYGKAVQVSMPPLEPDVFEGFLQSCQLSSKYLPESLPAPGVTPGTTHEALASPEV
jgi:hypothetical protein